MAGRYVSEIEVKANIQQSLNQIAELQGKIERIGNKEYKINLDMQSQQIKKVIGNLEKMLDSLGKGTGDFKQFENLSKELSSVVSEVQSLSKAFGKVDDSGTKTLLSSIQNIDKSLSELSQHILSVNKNMSNMGGNTSGAVRQVENIGNAAADAVKQVDKLADAQSKLGNKTNISSGLKDAIHNGTAENLEKVAQSEQKVQQEAVEADKALDNITFTPNTEGFDEVINKFKILKNEAEQISKITKTSKWNETAGRYDVSYKANLKNGSSYYLGESSKPQTLNANETVYDSKVLEKAYEEAKQINNALNTTSTLLKSMTVPSSFEHSFDVVKTKVEQLNKDLTNGKISIKDYGNAIKTELNGFNNSVGEKEKQIWNELTNSLQKYSTLQKRIASGKALVSDNEEATKLLERIYELQRSDILSTEKLNTSNERLKQIYQTVTDLKAKLKESTADSIQSKIDAYNKMLTKYSTATSPDVKSTEYTNKLTNFKNAISKLKEYKDSLAGVSEITEKQRAEIKQFESECETSANALKNMSAAEKGFSELSISKVLQRANKDLQENTRYSAKAKAGIKALTNQLKSGSSDTNLKQILNDLIKIENAEIAAGRAGKSLWDIFKTKSTYGFIGQMQSYLSMYVGFYGMVNKVRNAVTTIRELDTALVDLKKTTTMSGSELEKFYLDANNVAKQLGVTTQEVITQASAWSRLGFSTAEASTEMAKLSSQFASISPGMDVDQSQQGLVSIMKAWSIDPDQVKSEIMDPINRLGNTMALSNQDIIEGMQRSAAALAAVGTSTKDAFAMFSGIQEVVQNAEKSGTSLRSLAMRIRSFDEETGEYSDDLANITGELADLTKTSEHSQGISIFKDSTKKEFKEFPNYFREVSEIWDEMDQKQQNDYLLKAFGRTQAQSGAALIQNFKGVDKALQEMEQSAGSADKEMSIIEQSLDYKINKLGETWVGITQNLVDRGDLGNIVDGLTKVSDVIGSIVSNLGLLKTAAIGVAGYLSFKNIGKCYVSA